MQAVVGSRIQRGMTREFQSAGELALGRVDLKMCDRHGRHRADQTRIQALEQSSGDLREFVVQVEMDASAQERNRLDQSLYVWV